MRRRVQWENPSHGPDWTDVAVAMKAVGDFHQCLIILSMSAGVFDGGALYGSLCARSVSEDASVLGQPILALALEYPCKTHKELASCVFAAVYQMDVELSKKVWKQSNMAFTPK